jgi:hypothetical protein
MYSFAVYQHCCKSWKFVSPCSNKIKSNSTTGGRWDTAVGIETGISGGRPRDRHWILRKRDNFFFFKTVHIGCGAHRPFCVTGTGSSISGVKQPLHESDHSLQSWWGARMRGGKLPPHVYASWRGDELAVPYHSWTCHPAFTILVARIRYHLKRLRS